MSEYLRQLEVFIIPINDAPGKKSLRAKTETQLIALCTEGLQPIDRPNANWLGLNSPMSEIVHSGIWNLRDVGCLYDPNGVGSVESISSIEDPSLHE